MDPKRQPPWTAAVDRCRRPLPWTAAMDRCHGPLPWTAYVGPRGPLPWTCKGIRIDIWRYLKSQSCHVKKKKFTRNLFIFFYLTLQADRREHLPSTSKKSSVKSSVESLSPKPRSVSARPPPKRPFPQKTLIDTGMCSTVVSLSLFTH